MHLCRLILLAVLCACLSSGMASADVSLELLEVLEPGLTVRAGLNVTNDTPLAAAWKVSYSLQVDHAFYNVQPPDPVFGSDHALGAKCWTVFNDKTIEQGSLTDGLDYTDASTDWSNDGITEAFQYIDLGKIRNIKRMTYTSGDANHSWRVDIAVSVDDKTYIPVPDAQGVDIHQKWGRNEIPLKQPVKGRYIRLRYHNNGEKVPVLRMPVSFSVYDGVSDEKWDIPRVGEVISSGTLNLKIAADSASTTSIPLNKPLPSGMYLLAIKMESKASRQLILRHVMVLPEPMKSVSPESRFGINASNPEWPKILRRLGVGWVRFENMKWPFVSPEPGKYYFDGTVQPWVVKFDEIYSNYTKEGLSVLPFLFETAGYSSSAPDSVQGERRYFYPPKNDAEYAEFTYQVAARYGSTKHQADDLKTSDAVSGLGYIHNFELWNEPNLTDPGWGPWVSTSARFLEMFRAGAEGVKSADPTAKISSAGYAGVQVKTVDELRTYTYADGNHPIDFIDILNVHYYSGRVAPELATDDLNAKQTGNIVVEDEFRNLVEWRNKTKPGMPVWLSETGYDSAGPFGTDEHTQCARLPRVIMLALSTGIDKVFVYREGGSTPSMHAASGLLRNDGTYKPSYLTYATLIRELDGVTGGAIKLPINDKNMRLYAWKKGSDWILTGWMVEGTSKLNINLSRATVTDAFGYRSQMDLTKGIELSIYPVYIRSIGNLKALLDMVH